jgi:hypothetical protein
MKKIFFFAALLIGAQSFAQNYEAGYLKTLVDEQADPTQGQCQLYNLEYYSDGSLLLHSSYQTASADETGLVFGGKAYKGATTSKWGSREGDMQLKNMRNSFLAKIDANGELLWARPDTTGDYDLSNTAVFATEDGGVIYADKFRTRKGVYMGFINLLDKNGNVVASNNMSFTNYDSILVDGKLVKRKDAFNWAGAALSEDSFVYVAGAQADTLLPVWNDSIAPRKAWNTKGNLTDNCNTFILKYKPEYNQSQDLTYVGAVINSDDLVSDRPLGFHYENGKLYVAGTYNNGSEKGIFAARYDKDLKREYIQYHPITGALQFQQTKFEDGKIFVCGGLSKGSITIGEKTKATTGNSNHGLVYVMSMADGSVVNADVHPAANNALNITVAAFPTKDGYVAFNHETLNGLQMALHYDSNLNLVSTDTLGQGGGSSTISCVGRSADGKHTALGIRARTTGDYSILGETFNFADKTNWYSVIATLNNKEETTGIETTPSNSPSRGEKILRNGQLIIRHNGREYNILGF